MGWVTADQARAFFGDDFAGARSRFAAACAARGRPVATHVHPLAGPDREALGIDVARFGPEDARRLLVLLSGTHGLEGQAGSGCQVGWIASDQAERLPADTAVLVVHMLNPWGCAWRRRQNEDNVDLNRNFVDFAQGLPGNPGYAALHDAVVEADPARIAEADARLERYRVEQGQSAYAEALFKGQYSHPAGIGFGGQAPTWSHATLLAILDAHVRDAEQVALVDVHTGLGPYGHGALLSLDAPGSFGLETARAWYGPAVVATNHDGSLPYRLEGDLYSGVRRHVERSGRARVVALALEFGTFEAARLLSLQIDDVRTSRDGGHSEAVRGALKQFFYPATPDWLQLLCLRTLQVTEQALHGLSR